MIATALNRSWNQILHPKFRHVFWVAIAAAAATLALLTMTLNAYWPETYNFGWDALDDVSDWIAAAGFWAIVTTGSYFLFPGIVTMVMSFLADKIALAVEEEYYPNRIGTRPVPVAEVVLGAIKMTLLMIFINALALFPYLILLATTAGAGTLMLFVSVNGFLLGREYYEMVASRHMPPRAVRESRIRNSGKIFVGGCIMAGLFLIPVLNIIAPIVGAAMMTHLVHLMEIPSHHSERA